MKTLSLYIHIPFCKTICLYCNFLTFAHKNKQIPAYITALQQEITQKAKVYPDVAIDTIYFGGGTPSLIKAEQIEMILQTVRDNFKLNKNVEITIECNPESIDLPKINYYQQLGINRISLGIQNFDRKILFRIARPHDHLTIFKALDAIHKSGLKNYGADFIIGLPHQTLKHFKDQLKQILTFKIPHLSFYFLSYDTNRIDIFRADCPSEDLQIRMYEHLIRELAKAKYIHYEVSNYSQPGFESRHNLRYWNQEEYLGFGLGAHSYIDSMCMENERDFDGYLKNPLGIHEKVEIDDELHKLEYIMLKLRTYRGIDQKSYQQKFGDIKELLKKAQPYLESGQLVNDVKSLRASENGFLILDRITQDLL